jgi:mono/diheme cytochrome c family protein
MKTRALKLTMTLLLAGCEMEGVFVTPEPQDERMVDQRRMKPFDPNPYFVDGRSMRPPPAGTIDRGAYADEETIAHGVDRGGYVKRIPVPRTRDLVVRGRERFGVFCATCHGVLGDGVSAVAEKMTLVKPRSLIDGNVPSYPDGRIFRTITEGYGLMPPYAAQLPVMDRWAVVAYVRALEAAVSRLDALPPALQAEAARTLP